MESFETLELTTNPSREKGCVRMAVDARLLLKLMNLVRQKSAYSTTETASYLPFLLLDTKLKTVNTCFLKPVSKVWLYVAVQYFCYQSKFKGRLQVTLLGKEMLLTLHPPEEKLSE